MNHFIMSVSGRFLVPDREAVGAQAVSMYRQVMWDLFVV